MTRLTSASQLTTGRHWYPTMASQMLSRLQAAARGTLMYKFCDLIPARVRLAHGRQAHRVDSIGARAAVGSRHQAAATKGRSSSDYGNEIPRGEKKSRGSGAASATYDDLAKVMPPSSDSCKCSDTSVILHATR